MLDLPVFAAVKADDADPPAGTQAVRYDTEELCQAGHFVIDEHAQSLKRPGGRMKLAALVGGSITPIVTREPLCFEHHVDKLLCSRDGFDGAVADDTPCDALGIRLIGKVVKTGRQFGYRKLGEQIGSRAGQANIHPHVQRSIVLVAKTATGIVDLHARHTQISKDDVIAVEPFAGKELSKPGEMAAMEANLRAVNC